MQLKKLLQGTVFAAVAAACVMFGSVNASAATTAVTDSGVTVDLDTASATLKVTGGSGKEVLFGIGTVKGGKLTVASWDVYDGATANIDLSKLSNTKDSYLVVMSNDKTVPTVIALPAADKMAVAEFAANDATLKFGAGKDKSSATTSTKGFEYRTAYSSWTTIASDAADTALPDWSKYQNQGATIYCRKPGTASATLTASTDKVTYNGSGTDVEVKLYTSKESLPGKEAKVNIAARAKGPSVAADYAKGTVSVPKSTEVRVIAKGTTDTQLKATTENKTAAKVPASDFFNTEKYAYGQVASTDTSVAVEVRTAADKDKKKAASKWTRVTVDKPFEATVSAQSTANTTKKDSTDGKAQEWGNAGIGGSTLATYKEASTDSSSVITATYKTTKVKGVDTYTTVEFKNTSTTYDYEIYVASEKKAPDTSAKGKVVKKSGATLALKITDGQYVYIRRVGDKKTKLWVGSWQEFGIVDYPKSEPKSTT